MTGIKVSFLCTCHTPSHKSKEDKSFNFCGLICRVILLKFVEGCLPKGNIATLSSFSYSCSIWFLASEVLVTDVFSPVTGNFITFYSVSPLGSGTLKDTFLFCTFSILTPNEAEEETGLSPDLHHQLWQIQCIYCSCIANSEDLVFEDAWIHSQFSVMLPWIFCKQRSIILGEAKSVQSLGVWEKVQVDLKLCSCQLSKAFCSGGSIPARC